MTTHKHPSPSTNDCLNPSLPTRQTYTFGRKGGGDICALYLYPLFFSECIDNIDFTSLMTLERQRLYLRSGNAGCLCEPKSQCTQIHLLKAQSQNPMHSEIRWGKEIPSAAGCLSSLLLIQRKPKTTTIAMLGNCRSKVATPQCRVLNLFLAAHLPFMPSLLISSDQLALDSTYS